MSADLHLHTHYSDGNWSPRQLVDEAVRLHFECMAVTDHDTVAGLVEAKESAQGRIRLIDGIELNTVWINPEGFRQDVHVLGYFIDPQNLQLQEAIQTQQKARMDYVEETVEKLRSGGFKIDMQDVLNAAGKGSVGRPHICMAMLKSGAINDVSKAYRMLMNRHSEFRIDRRSISPEQAISAITAAGGIPSLAHPGKEKNMDVLLPELCRAGLKAIEAYHRGHSLAMVKKYLKLARTMNLLITGGSDCHGPFEDFPASIGTIRVAADVVQRLDEAHKKIHCK